MLYIVKKYEPQFYRYLKFLPWDTSSKFLSFHLVLRKGRSVDSGPWKDSRAMHSTIITDMRACTRGGWNLWNTKQITFYRNRPWARVIIHDGRWAPVQRMTVGGPSSYDENWWTMLHLLLFYQFLYGTFNSENTFRSHVWRRDNPYNIPHTAFRQALFLSSKPPSLPALEKLLSVNCPDLVQTTEATRTSPSGYASLQRQLPSQ